MSWLSPSDIQSTFRIGKTTAFNLLKEYKASGREIIRIGKLTRVPEEQFTEFLKERGNEEHH
jgi:hypothetical protein